MKLLVLMVVSASAVQMHLDPETTKKFTDLGKQLQNASWKHPKASHPEAPAHIKAAVKKQREVLGVVPVVKRGGCGKNISQKALGLKPKPLASLLSFNGHPGRDSYSVPGAGGTQDLKDDGRSTHGKVNGEEPFVTVLKDGYFEVGCYNDMMNEFGDKFGNGKHSYRNQDSTSIARYEELVLKDEQVAMTSTVCFEFCRSLPDMVFFGITNGRNCYCTPYFKPGPGDDKKCDSGCEGDPTIMCGNQKKSTLWEMHLCADTAQDLEESMTTAKEALDFFFEEAVLTSDLAKNMNDGGAALQEAGGLAGAPSAGDNGQAAMMAGKPLSQGYQAGLDDYNTLLGAYKDADKMKSKDFTVAADQTAAEFAIRTIKATAGPVLGAAQSMHAAAKLAYPSAATLLGDEPEAGDGAAVALAKEDHADEFDYRQAAYAMDTTFPASMSSCQGPVVGSPMIGLSATECGTACSATVYPTKCVGFSYYAVKGKEGTQHLCFMLADIKELVTFQCPDGGDCVPDIKSAPKDVCQPSAVCMIKMSEISTGYKPKAEWKQAKRCFGEPSKVGAGFSAYEMPSLGASVKLLGKTELEAAL